MDCIEICYDLLESTLLCRVCRTGLGKCVWTKNVWILLYLGPGLGCLCCDWICWRGWRELNNEAGMFRVLMRRLLCTLMCCVGSGIMGL